jgi:Uma2 family endonuclease
MATVAEKRKKPNHAESETNGSLPRLHRFTVQQYDQMVETGILTTNDRVELLEGWIIEKMSQNPPHRSTVSRVIRRLSRILPDDWTLSCQAPIALSDSEPEPDIMIARGEESTYDDRHPTPSDLGVLMEVGDSSVLSDRRYKGELYAREKVPEFWLINVVERKVEVGTAPRRGKYQKKVEYGENDMVPLVLDGDKIAGIPVRELLPKP